MNELNIGEPIPNSWTEPDWFQQDAMLSEIIQINVLKTP